MFTMKLKSYLDIKWKTRHINKFKVIAPALLSIFTVGCDNTSNNSHNTIEASRSPEAQVSGYFSSHSGVGYTTSSGIEGETDLGEFSYVDGDEVVFSVGDLVLGTVSGASLVTVFDFESPDNVAKILYGFDDDQNPYSGIVIPSHRSISSMTTGGKSFAQIAAQNTVIEVSELSEEEVNSVLISKGVEPYLSSDATDMEFLRLISRDIEQEKIYQYLNNDIYLYGVQDHDAVKGHLNNSIQGRLNLYIYRQHILPLAMVAGSTYSNNVAAIEKVYDEYNQFITDSVLSIDYAFDYLELLESGDLSVDTAKKQALIQAINYYLNQEGGLEAAVDRSSSSYVDKKIRVVLACVIQESAGNAYVNEKKITEAELELAAHRCLKSGLFDSVRDLVEFSVNEHLVVEQILLGLTDVGESVYDVAFSCSKFVKRDASDTLSCLNDVTKESWKYVSKTVSATTGIYRLYQSEKDYKIAMSAYTFVGDLIAGGDLEAVADMYDVRKEYNAAESLGDKEKILMEAALSEVMAEDQTLTGSEFERARKIYEKAFSDIAEIRKYYVDTVYKDVFDVDSGGYVQALNSTLVDQYRRSFLSVDIGSVKFHPSTSEVEICTTLSLKKNISNVFINSREVAIGSQKNISESFSSPIILQKKSPTRTDCNSYKLDDLAVESLIDDFVVSVTYDFSKNRFLYQGEITANSVYSGINVEIPQADIDVNVTSDDDVFTITAVLNASSKFNDNDEFYIHWDARNQGSITYDESKSAFEDSIQFKLDSGVGSATLSVFATNSSGDTIAFREFTVQRGGADSIFLDMQLADFSITSGAKKVVTASISGGVAPYSLEMSLGEGISLISKYGTSGYYLLFMNELTSDINSSITIAVTDSVGDSVSSTARVKILGVESTPSLIGTISSMDTPEASVSSPYRLGVNESFTKQWGFISSYADLEGVVFQWDSRSDDGLDYQYKNSDIYIGNMAKGVTVPVDVDVRNTGSEAGVYTARWHMYHKLDGKLTPLYFQNSRVHAHIEFNVDTKSYQPPKILSFNLAESKSGLGRIKAQLELNTEAALSIVRIHCSVDNAVSDESRYFYHALDSANLNALIHQFELSDAEWSDTEVYCKPEVTDQFGNKAEPVVRSVVLSEVPNIPELDGGIYIQDTTGGFALSWRTASGDVDRYELYRSTASGSLGSRIYSGTSTNTTDTSLVSGRTYYYTAKACNSNGCSNSNQDYKLYAPTPVSTVPIINSLSLSESSSGIGKLRASLNISADASLSTVRLHCSRSASVSTSSSYDYRYADSSSLSTGSHTIYLQDSDWAGSRVYCKAEVVNVNGQKASFSIESVNLSAPVPISTAPVINSLSLSESSSGIGKLRASLNISADASLSTVRLHCSRSASVSTSSSYDYRYADSSSLSTGSHTIYLQDSDWAGSRVYCKAEVVNVNGQKASFTIESVNLSAPVSPPTLDGGVYIQDTTGGFALSWRSASGDVDRYELYRSTSSGSQGSRIYSGSSTSTTDTSLVAGRTYYYTAKACNSSGCDASNQDYKLYSPAPTYPDVTVSVSLDSSSYSVGDSVRITARVRNEGDASSNSGTITYYLSTNSSITNSDTQIGTGTFSSMSAGATSTNTKVSSFNKSTNGTTVYIGACVSSDPNEQVTSNNCSTGIGFLVN